ncbi:MAG: YjgP/YjgQ family permease, partial [Bacteroidales bacterium]|nr:YjgP/YjgQ family permease [Bacteroidales bacterium]
ISVFFFVVWYVITMSAEKMVQGNVISTIAGMWASSYLLLPIGIFLTYKAANDSAIMNIDTYFEKIKRIFNFLGKKKNNKE